MAKFITNYTAKYCGKCQDGFVKKILKTGEDVIVPCACKLEQDRSFLLKKLELDSCIQVYSHNSWNYQNRDTWLKLIVEDNKSIPNESLVKYFNDHFKQTTTKFVDIVTFLSHIGSWSPTEASPINFYLATREDSPNTLRYLMNFVALLYVNRLIPAKVISYTDLKSSILEKDKVPFEEILSESNVIILPDLFSSEFMEQLSNVFIYDRLHRFLRYLYKCNVSVITGGARCVLKIRNAEGFEGKKDIKDRAQALFDLILNNSRTVPFRLSDGK